MTTVTLPELVEQSTDEAKAVSKLVLTEDQEEAKKSFFSFLADPARAVFVLSGYAGCGKTTLVKTLLDELPSMIQTIKLLTPKFTNYHIELTATTNKAAEAMAEATGLSVSTIHSALGIRVQTDYRTRETKLSRNPNTSKLENCLLFIDEASYIDRDLLKLIFDGTQNCKIVFIGDPAQLTPVKSSTTPVFATGFSGAELKKIVRQAEGNPIIELSSLFRKTVETGEWPNFTPDGTHIIHLDRNAFEDEIIKEFSRPNWRYHDSKVLAWTNQCVINYNNAIREHVVGQVSFNEGDYAICNSFINKNRVSVKTDQLVRITSIGPQYVHEGVPGHDVIIDGKLQTFFPVDLKAAKERARLAKQEQEFGLLHQIDSEWIDLRAAYACTINKSQGSTYDKVFIDLDDVARCNNGDLLARMLYVATSRARHQVFFTGDLA